MHEQGRLIAFEHDGAFKWLSAPLLGIDWGGPSIADLDGDRPARDRARPAGAARRRVAGVDGARRQSRRQLRRDALPTVVDLDLDGTPEVLVGDAAYSNTGVLLWDNPSLPDGNTAVANFDADPFPEIVLVEREPGLAARAHGRRPLGAGHAAGHRHRRARP